MSAPRPALVHRRSSLGPLVWAVVLAGACARTSADRVSETPAAAPAAVAEAPAAAPAEPGDDQAEDGRHGVFIHPSLAEACGIARARTYFDFDSADLSQGSRFALAELGTCLKSGPLAGVQITIMGATDPRGTEAYNDELGLDRAQTVGDFLAEAGVDRSQMKLVSHGEENAHQADPLRWPFDRRVDIVRAGETPPPVPNPDAPTP